MQRELEQDFFLFPFTARLFPRLPSRRHLPLVKRANARAEDKATATAQRARAQAKAAGAPKAQSWPIFSNVTAFKTLPRVDAVDLLDGSR